MSRRGTNEITDEMIKEEFREQCDSGFAPTMTEDQFITSISLVKVTEDAAQYRIRCEYFVWVPLDVEEASSEEES